MVRLQHLGMATSKMDEKLAAKVNEQEEQLNKYKKRLQDVVIAHKKLIAEKERLEDSLKTLASITKMPENHTDANADDSSKEWNELNKKIFKLGQSLSVLAEEKRQMEADFQVERKQLVQQNTRLEEELKNLQLVTANAKKVPEVGVKSLKTQLNPEIDQQELDFASNIGELQKIINEERQKCKEKEYALEMLEVQLEDISDKLRKSRENEKQLQIQLNDTRKQLESETAPQFVMDKLKRELQIMKEQHNNAFQQAQMRALKAEEKVRKLDKEHENCISKLEQKLLQFSDLASNYNKHHQEDQQTIMKLENRLMQLELENNNTKCRDDHTVSNEETLVQQLQHIKHQLILGCKTADQLHDLQNLLLDGLKDPIKHDDLKFKKQYLELKQHFEEDIQNYSSNDDKDDSARKHEVNAYKAKLVEAEVMIAQLKQEIKLQRKQVNELLEKERQSWETKIISLESEYRNKTIVLEQELQKQRERVTAIIREKEKQMIDLQQSHLPVYQLSDDLSSSDTKRSLIYSGTRHQSTTIIYYLEEAARKEAEIRRLSKENNELQLKLHDVEKELFQQIQLYAETKQDIQRLRKQDGDPGELNNAYLKNVLLNYFLTTDSKMRTHMLNAIFTILKFSNLEINRVTKLKQYT